MDIASNAENYLWNNFKFFLMSRKTCLLDNLLKIKDSNAYAPIDRYEDFTNSLDKHIGLRSYVAGQATQFSRLPYITVGIDIKDKSDCSCRAFMSFSIAYSIDTPDNLTNDINYVGNSSEAVSQFKANMANALDEIMYHAWDGDNKMYMNCSFLDALKDTAWLNPITGAGDKDGNPIPWSFNVVSSVDDDKNVGEILQLKKEDRSSGLLVYTIVYSMDLYRLYDRKGNSCGC